jgi:hypothetical protein
MGSNLQEVLSASKIKQHEEERTEEEEERKKNNVDEVIRARELLHKRVIRQERRIIKEMNMQMVIDEEIRLELEQARAAEVVRARIHAMLIAKEAARVQRRQRDIN